MYYKQQASDCNDSYLEQFAATPEYRQHEHKYRDVHTSQHATSSLESATSVLARAATYSDIDTCHTRQRRSRQREQGVNETMVTCAHC